MNRKNEIVITMQSRSDNERFARLCAAAYLAPFDPTVAEMTEFKTVISEAVTNCVVHAYADKIGEIRLKFEQIGNDTVRVTVKDYGVGIDNIEKAMEPCYTTGGEDRSGMGFSIMSSFSDKLRVRSVPGKGTTVVFEKQVSIRHGR